jgi:alpha-tubulin suppressor-like RCC1 family protein
MKTGNEIICLAVIILGLLTVACGGGSGGGADIASKHQDSDGDGLSDYEELEKYGTSPIFADTDGDGFSDYVECVEYGFDPSKNPVKFNPCVADVPKLGFNLTSPPNVALELTDTTGTTHSFETSRSNESAKTVSTSTTDTNTHSVEMSHTSTASFGFSGWSLTGSVSYSFGHATTDETSHSYTEEQTQENRQTLTHAEAYENSNQIAASGGILMVTAEVENRSNMAFRVDNLLLSAVAPDVSNPGVFNPVGNLILDTSGNYKEFPKVTIGPGSKLVALNFINDGLDLETGKSLLADARSLVIIPSLYELTDPDGKAFAFKLTDIGAKDATVIIDYAGYRSPERYMVAANADPDHHGVTVGKVMQDYLHIPYEAGETTWDGTVRRGLLGLRNDGDVYADETKNGYWLVIHAWNDGVGTVAEAYDLLCPDYDGYDFEDIELKAGDTLHLVYVEDKDGDEIYSREEFLRGCEDDPSTGQDSDGDGLTDAEEIDKGTDPGRSDTDWDGLNDKVDPDPLVPTAYGLADNISSSKSSHVIKADGTLWAWGWNLWGQLGLGDKGNSQFTPSQVVGTGNDSNWSQVSTSCFHAAAIKKDGSLWTWGINNYENLKGLLGLGSDVEECLVPTNVLPGSDDWAAVATGMYCTLALKTSGHLYVFGMNNCGQLGLGEGIPHKYTPTLLEPESRWLDVSAGEGHVIAVKSDGSLWSWGSNASGQLGIGLIGGKTYKPTRVGDVDDYGWVQVAAGSSHSTALKADGTLYTWGSNAYGQIGDGTFGPDHLVPHAVDTCWKSVEAGGKQTFGVRLNGTLWSWGYNYFGELGLGHWNNQSLPTLVKEEENDWVQISGGLNHTLALEEDGTLWAWGRNTAGELGDGSGQDQPSPVMIMSVINE